MPKERNVDKSSPISSFFYFFDQNLTMAKSIRKGIYKKALSPLKTTFLCNDLSY